MIPHAHTFMIVFFDHGCPRFLVRTLPIRLLHVNASCGAHNVWRNRIHERIVHLFIIFLHLKWDTLWKSSNFVFLSGSADETLPLGCSRVNRPERGAVGTYWDHVGIGTDCEAGKEAIFEETSGRSEKHRTFYRHLQTSTAINLDSSLPRWARQRYGMWDEDSADLMRLSSSASHHVASLISRLPWENVHDQTLTPLASCPEDLQALCWICWIKPTWHLICRLTSQDKSYLFLSSPAFPRKAPSLKTKLEDLQAQFESATSFGGGEFHKPNILYCFNL